MGQAFQYLYPSQWIVEGSVWRPPDTITLRDEAGVAIGNSVMATMLLTIFDLSGGQEAIVNNADGTVSVLNARSCTLSAAGVFVPTFLPADTAILLATHPYELRRMLIQYEWPSPTPTKSDALEITVVIRNLAKRPYVAP